VTDWSTIASPATAGGTLVLSALRDPAADTFQVVADAVKADQLLVIDLLYGDFEGGQRVITQFSLRPVNERWLAQATRHFNVDRARSSLGHQRFTEQVSCPPRARKDSDPATPTT
jgi:hypothetical protein